MVTKADILDALQEKQQRWEALLEEVGPERMEQPGVNGDWSMKDIVAHLTGWNRRVAANMEAALRGDPAPATPWPATLDSDDDVNAWIYETYHGRSLQDVLDESRQVNQQIYDTVESLPDDTRLERVDPAYYLVWLNDQRYLPGEFYDHLQDDHEPDIRARM
jgi:hypothetical protein